MVSSPQLIQAGKGEALRIRAILRSLVPLEDLVGVISLPVQIPSFGKGKLFAKREVWWLDSVFLPITTQSMFNYTLC